MPHVRIASPLRMLTEGRSEVQVPVGTVGGVIDALERRHPGFEERLLDGRGELQPFVSVFVGDDEVRTRAGLATPVHADDVVSIVPAVAGGSRVATADVAGRRPTVRHRSMGSARMGA